MEERKNLNPFGGDKSRWTESKELFHGTANDTTPLLFVNFGFHNLALHRKDPYDMACKGRTMKRLDDISCNKDRKTTPRETYEAASKYLFGLSPPGNGKDCFRTYELLFHGLIPIVQYQAEYTELFDDLPILQLPHWKFTQQQLLDKMREFVSSPKFKNNNFSKGWSRMLLSYWRYKVLEDAGRLNEIVYDENGDPYYTMWSYTSYHPPHIEHAVSKDLARKIPPKKQY